jgi:hypothetical protein
MTGRWSQAPVIRREETRMEWQDTQRPEVEIGRVLRASSAGFAIGCRVSQLSLPSFGGLVKAQPADQREAVYGIIYDMHIDDDPLVRRLVLAQDPGPATIEDQRANRLLPIEMSVLNVGYRLDGQIRHGMPPRPPLNLDPVYLCQDGDELRAFTDRPSYLRLLMRAGAERVPMDQLLVAHVGQIYVQRGRDVAWAKQMIAVVIDSLRNDYDVLMPTLEALDEALPGFAGVSGLADDLF